LGNVILALPIFNSEPCTGYVREQKPFLFIVLKVWMSALPWLDPNNFVFVDHSDYSLICLYICQQTDLWG